MPTIYIGIKQICMPTSWNPKIRSSLFPPQILKNIPSMSVGRKCVAKFAGNDM